QFRNPVRGRGPIEGRPPGELFAHQRWEEFFPKVGYVMSIAPVAPNTRFHPNFPAQNPNAVWCYGTGRFVNGTLPPPLFKGRYGEPILTRVYQNLPVNRVDNGGFGRHETHGPFPNTPTRPPRDAPPPPHTPPPPSSH